MLIRPVLESSSAKIGNPTHTFTLPAPPQRLRGFEIGFVSSVSPAGYIFILPYYTNVCVHLIVSQIGFVFSDPSTALRTSGPGPADRLCFFNRVLNAAPVLSSAPLSFPRKRESSFPTGLRGQPPSQRLAIGFELALFLSPQNRGILP